MERRWQFQVHYLFILTHLINAKSNIILQNGKTVYGLRGSNVTLSCSIPKEKDIYVTQTQWTKIKDGRPRKIAVYHPTYGTRYHEMAYSYSVSFRKDVHNCLGGHTDITASNIECSQWILQLKNVSLEMSGLYECNFATYPTGTSRSEINLVVKNSVKPEISIGLQASFTREANITCVVRKAFPKPDLQWYMGGEILKDKSRGISIQKEDAKFEGGFYERRSLLTIRSTTWPSIYQPFKCMSVYPFPGNDISSEEIVLPYEFQTTSLPLSESVTQVTQVSDSPTQRLQTTTMEASKSSSQVTPVLDSLTKSTEPGLSTKNLQDNTITKISSYSAVPQRNLSTSREPEVTTLITLDLSSTGKDWFNNTGDLNSTRRVTEETPLTSHDNSSTIKDQFKSTGTATSPGKTSFPWPAVVAVLLLLCTCLFILGVRKWCQYQREILNRPPSFKPPPPPVKYTSIQELEGMCSSCNEEENGPEASGIIRVFIV
ncbi:LOW QUALITY PROTEIN: T-cell surface protein tactile [Podarcis raffonei]|uniref:LOW QUALITY PROTEIN: T-cell surface protein tactile n=1 Tax=Podarcis raffonei TaxID=65483 RepID=UPI0023298CA6|nr:LOW QUALITY PROTEIN: T-cell surface protein tactile [Podarcis raffonei]